MNKVNGASQQDRYRSSRPRPVVAEADPPASQDHLPRPQPTSGSSLKRARQCQEGPPRECHAAQNVSQHVSQHVDFIHWSPVKTGRSRGRRIGYPTTVGAQEPGDAPMPCVVHVSRAQSLCPSSPIRLVKEFGWSRPNSAGQGVRVSHHVI